MEHNREEDVAAQASPGASGPDSFREVPFTVDAQLLAELGERLVGRSYIALAELVKNSYDADARHCEVVFEQDRIIVRDDGHGMTEQEFEARWMRVGTTHKRDERVSPRFHRPLTGSKGIGRLAVQYLAERLTLYTTSADDMAHVVEAGIDWPSAVTARHLTTATAMCRVTERDRDYAGHSGSGTEIRLEGLNHPWTQDDLRELARELWWLQPPLQDLYDDEADRPEPFRIAVRAGMDESVAAFEEQMRAPLDNWEARILGRIQDGIESQECLATVEFRDGEKHVTEFRVEDCALDHARFEIRVFRLSHRQRHGLKLDELRKYFAKHGGVHIYDAGFRLPYYGVEQDWLGLELDHSHRRVTSRLLPKALQEDVDRPMNELPTMARIFGIVRVDTGHEAEVAEETAAEKKHAHPLGIQVSRDRLTDNKAYRDLVYAVRWSIDWYALRVRIRRHRDNPKPDNREAVGKGLGQVRDALNAYKSEMSADVFRKLETEVENVVAAEKAAARGEAEERALLGALATAGIAAVALVHETNKELTKLEHHAGRIERLGRELELEDLGKIATKLKTWVEHSRATRQLFLPLMTEEDREKKVRLRARAVLHQISANAASLLRKASVDVEQVPETMRLPAGTMIEWNAVFQNVFFNAVNAMVDSVDRRIVCRGEITRTGAYVDVMDTGVGVDLDRAEDYFKPFVRELEISEDRRALGLGGVGLGLTIVRTIADSLGCGTAFVEPPTPFATAFRLSWRSER